MNLYLRADGSRALGLGHVARCYALAQEARRRGMTPRFLTRRLDGKAEEKLALLGQETILLAGPADSPADLSESLDAIRRTAGREGLAGAILVTDHTGLDAAWIAGAREAGPVVVCLNDLPAIRYESQIVVNGNLGAKNFAYDAAPDTRLLLGPAYLLFRDAFLAAGLRRKADPQRARRIVISLGAGDAGNATERVLDALSAIPDSLSLTIVAGGAYGHLASLEQAARRSPHDVAISVDLPETAHCFAAAELAICAGGSTAYEMALLGVPAIVLVLSETQKDAARALDAAGVALCAGVPDPEAIAREAAALCRDSDRRRSMRERGTALFDGLGRGRVLDAARACLPGAGGAA
ncbi:MAG: UDP-2,4-diacetamido-2,4,6-trideoxy-beta-L-altropyranose hydrolase [Myxococcota bacterium]